MFITRFAAALLAFVALSACEITHYGGKTPEGRPTKVVVFDDGGWITWYDQHMQELLANGTRVEIRGGCMSACTMYLGAAEVCVHPEADIGFHGSIQVIKAITKAEGDALMAKYYTPALRKWFYKNAAHIQGSWISLTGQEMHDRFGYALCDT